MIIPTYNEAENIKPIVARVRAAVPEARHPRRRRQQPRRHRQARRRARGRRRPRPRPAPQGQGRASAPPTSRASAGASSTATTSWSRWTPTAPTSPRSCPGCSTALKGADLVLGSRWVPGGRVVNWPKSPRGPLPRRQPLLPAAARRADPRRHRRLPRLPHARPCEGLGLDEVASQGYCFQVDLAWRAVEAGFHVVEVPITFVERELRRLAR